MNFEQYKNEKIIPPNKAAQKKQETILSITNEFIKIKVHNNEVLKHFDSLTFKCNNLNGHIE